MQTIFLLILLIRCDLDKLMRMVSADDGTVTFGFAFNIIVLILGVQTLFLFSTRERWIVLFVWGPYVLISIISFLYCGDVASGAKFLIVTLTSASVFSCAMLLSRSHSKVFLAKIVILSAFI